MQRSLRLSLSLIGAAALALASAPIQPVSAQEDGSAADIGVIGGNADALDKAMGRLTGGLYIVTASKGDVGSKQHGAMVASWVTQASFTPPGLTVAVAKDRAIEPLMQVDDRFVINILSEENYQPLLDQFLKPFPPGTNRFEGVNVLNNVAKGGHVISDAIAHLDCVVKQRLETADHFIIYAVVEQGNVANTEAKTAVHHRKVGNSY